MKECKEYYLEEDKKKEKRYDTTGTERGMG